MSPRLVIERTAFYPEPRGPLCKRYKGSDIASVDRAGHSVRFFNPRRDIWDEHFRGQLKSRPPLHSPKPTRGLSSSEVLTMILWMVRGAGIDDPGCWRSLIFGDIFGEVCDR